MNSTTKSAFYDTYHAYVKNKGSNKIIGENNFTYFYLVKHIAKAIQILSTFSNRKKLLVLDVGCGVGTISLFLAERGHNVLGIDISPDAIELAKKSAAANGIYNAKFLCADISELKLAKKFDLIVCFEIIEHVQEDEKLLKKVKSLLTENGVLILSTPSKSSLLYRLGLLKTFDRKVGHVRRYRLDGLAQLLRNAGFKILSHDQNESFLRNSLYVFPKFGYLIKLIRGPLVSLFHIVDELFVKLTGESDLIFFCKRK